MSEEVATTWPQAFNNIGSGLLTLIGSAIALYFIYKMTKWD